MRKSVLQGFMFNIGGAQYCDEALMLFARMTAVGETPTVARMIAINNCIVSLKANDLFSNQFDVLVVTRGYGVNSTKLNWIKDMNNAVGVNSPIYTAGVGYSTNGALSYINSKFRPSTNGVKYTLNNNSFILKIGGAGANPYYEGNVNLEFIGTLNRAHSSLNFGISDGGFIGYVASIRTAVNANSIIQNSAKYDYNINSVSVPISEMFILACSVDIDTLYSVAQYSTEVNELYAFGKSITQEKFISFQNIMNMYFASI